MRKYILTLVLISLCFLSYDFAYGGDFKKTRIAVLDFQIQGTGFETEDMGKIVAEWMITALVQEGRFDVIERRLLEKVLKEQNLGASGVVDTQSASRLGKVLGARVVISGTVIKLSRMTEVNTRLIDVQTGSILAAENVNSETTTRLAKLINLMAIKIIKNFPLEGYIVERSGDRAFIDLGKRAGVRKGLQFIVYKEGKVIRHPKTGEILDIEHIETGRIKVESIKEKTSTAKIIKESSDGVIAYGQLVRSAVEKSRGEREIGFYSMPPEDRQERQKREKARDSKAKFGTIDEKVERARALKAEGNSQWKSLVMEAFRDAKLAYRTNTRSPEVFLLFAKCYWVNNRLKKAEGSLQKAFYFNSKFTDGYIFRGEMYYEEGLKGSYKFKARAKSSFESAMMGTDIDNETKAMILYKLGKVHSDLYDDKTKAKELWNKAVESAAGSTWGSRAQESLASL
jgi:TolB-like protein